jgi:hypothetical protein
MTAKFRFVGTHADTLADGRPVEPGEFINLSDEEVEEAHNASLIHDGLLIGTGSKSTDLAETTSKKVQRQVDKEGSEEA